MSTVEFRKRDASAPQSLDEVPVVGRSAPETGKHDLGGERVCDLPTAAVGRALVIKVCLAKSGYQREKRSDGGLGVTFGVEVHPEQHVVLGLQKLLHGVSMNSIVLLEQKARGAVHSKARKVEPKLQGGLVKVPLGPDAVSLSKIAVAVTPRPEPVMGVCRQAPVELHDGAFDV